MPVWPAPRSKLLRVGFVPTSDCAPLLMARELGLFEKYNLEVRLRREIGWAAIRDKIIYGELDAAHALASLPFMMTLGLGSVRCECATALVLNQHGNAITLSADLWQRGVRDAASLRHVIEHARGKITFTFGVVFPHSSHEFLLRQWLLSGGINPDRDVRLVVVPPPAMFSSLKGEHLDGYCVGEPWNSLAVQAGIGWCPAVSAQLAPGHPEKVLLVRRDFTETHAAEHVRLIAALLEACAWCDEPENHERLIATLARPEAVNVPAHVLRRGLAGPFDFGQGRVELLPDFNLFSKREANEPTAEKAAWIVRHLTESGAIKDRTNLHGFGLWKTFRSDIFDQARELVAHTTTHEPCKTHETELLHA